MNANATLRARSIDMPQIELDADWPSSVEPLTLNVKLEAKEPNCVYKEQRLTVKTLITNMLYKLQADGGSLIRKLPVRPFGMR